MVKPSKANEIIRVLKKEYDIGSWRSRPFRTLISCIISQRTKDETTGPAAERLFKAANTPQDMAKLTTKQIAKLIYPAGFYNQKAKNIKATCKMLLKKYNGRVPKTRAKLMELPGIGGKCADIVLLFSYGECVIPVDTHVAKVSRRLGWTAHNEREKIREDLHALFPPRKRAVINSLLVTFGKDICKAPVPRCFECPIENLCPYPNKNYKFSKNPKKV